MHLAGCLYLGILLVLVHVDGRLDFLGGSGIGDSNTLGMNLAAEVVSAAVLLLPLRRWRWLLLATSIIFSLNTIGLARSRGAFLGLVAGLIILAFLRPPAYERLFVIFASLGMLALGSVASPQFWERMHTVTAVTSENPDETDTSGRSRIVMFNAQLHLAKSYPFEIGLGGSEFLSARYLEENCLTPSGARSFHNSLMTDLVEQGIPGFILLLALVFWACRVQLGEAKSNGIQVVCAIHSGAIGGGL